MKRGLELLEGKKGTTYADSRYAYGIVHTFGKIWSERGYLNSKGKTLRHEKLVREVLEALMRPEEIAVVHIKGHQKGTSVEIEGNNLANRQAKQAALEKEEATLLQVDLRDEKEEEIPIFNEKEQEELKKNGGKKKEKVQWILPDGRQVLNKVLTKRILENLHQSTHWGTQAICDHFLHSYGCVRAFKIARAVTKNCMICQKINKKGMRKTTQGGRELARKPFQNIQIDFTELPPVKIFKYLLVIVDHLTHWVEAFPTVSATTNIVTKILLE